MEALDKAWNKGYNIGMNKGQNNGKNSEGEIQQFLEENQWSQLKGSKSKGKSLGKINEWV